MEFKDISNKQNELDEKNIEVFSRHEDIENRTILY